MVNRRRLWLSSCLVLLVACAGGPPPTPVHPPLQVAIDFWPGYYPLFIAEAQGYFAEAGVSVNAVTPENTDSILIGFAKGEYDALAIGLGDIINLTETTPDVVVIMASDESSGGDAMLTLDPTIQTVADLRGKRVGTNLGGFGELFITQVLGAHGLRPNDVAWVNLDAAVALAKLQAGEVDAAHTWEPYATAIEQAGGRRLFSSADTPGLIPDVLAFQGKTVRDRPAEMRGFVQAWFRAVDFWLAYPAEGNALIGQALNLDPASISLQGVKLQTLQGNRALFTPGEKSIYAVAQQYIEFFVQKGSLSRRPDVNQLLTNTYLPAP